MRSRLLRHFLNDDGIALLMALGVLVVLTIAGTTAIYYSSTNSRSAGYSKSTQVAYSLGEAGAADALSRLATASNPLDPNLLPPTTLTLGSGTALYSGTLAGTVWTISSRGRTANPTVSADATRLITRRVDVHSLDVGSINPAWDRIYSHNNTTECSVELEGTSLVAGLFSARGNVCLEGSARLTGSTVDIGGNLKLKDAGTSVGTVGTPIASFRIASTCKYMLQSSSPAPCSSYDHVYASSYGSAPQNLVKPTASFSYWFDNAKPGPKQGCTTQSGTPPQFDSQPPASATYDKSLLTEQELTPRAASYVCQVRDAEGALVGELSWDHVKKVLTVRGTIFFDGSFAFRDDDDVNNYQGRGAIYASGKWHNDEVICANSSGTYNCRTSGMTTWDPSANLLAIVVGGLEVGGDAVHAHKNSAFQGILYSAQDCKIDNNPYFSGPMICEEIESDDGSPQLYTWPALPPADGEQVYDVPPAADLQLILGGQSG